MSTAKHTPGPWFIWQERAMQEEGMDREEIDFELSEQEDHCVMAGSPVGKVTRSSIVGCLQVTTLDAFEFGDDDDQGRELALANARLIAAAPDLLDAARAAWNCIAELPCTQARSELALQLQDAVEKAIGVSP